MMVTIIGDKNEIMVIDLDSSVLNFAPSSEKCHRVQVTNIIVAKNPDD